MAVTGILHEQRIKQLEHQCATLAAEIDLMRPVVEAVAKLHRHGWVRQAPRLYQAITAYEASKPK